MSRVDRPTDVRHAVRIVDQCAPVVVVVVVVVVGALVVVEVGGDGRRTVHERQTAQQTLEFAIETSLLFFVNKPTTKSCCSKTLVAFKIVCVCACMSSYAACSINEHVVARVGHGKAVGEQPNDGDMRVLENSLQNNFKK